MDFTIVVLSKLITKITTVGDLHKDEKNASLIRRLELILGVKVKLFDQETVCGH